jgi:hypothetical protein
LRQTCMLPTYSAVKEHRIFPFPFHFLPHLFLFSVVLLLDRWNQEVHKVCMYFGVVQILNWFVGCAGTVKFLYLKFLWYPLFIRTNAITRRPIIFINNCVFLYKKIFFLPYKNIIKWLYEDSVWISYLSTVLRISCF